MAEHSPPGEATVFPGTDPRGPSRELVVTGIIAAPRARVFQAWTVPALLQEWWAPPNFTIPVCKMDLRPGGAYRIVVRSPEGVDYPLKGVYGEIIEPERLVMTADVHEHPGEWHELLNSYRRDAEGIRAPELLWTVTFKEHDGKTTVVIRTDFASIPERDAMLEKGMSEKWVAILARLARHLSGSTRQ